MSYNPSSLPVAAPSIDPAREIRFAGYQTLIMLALAHFFIDLYSSALGSFQPMLGAKFGLNLSQAGLLGGALVFSSSLLQPLYGILSDRSHSRLFTVLAPATAGVFISSLGAAEGFAGLITMVLLGGAGVASFHPQASAHAAAGISGNKSRSMAIFISAGTLGMSFGPVFFSWLTGRYGVERSWLGAIPGLLMSALLALLWSPAKDGERKKNSRFNLGALRSQSKPLLVHFLLVFLRSVVQMVFTQFLPLYLHRERGFSVQSAALGLTLYLGCGAIGGFLGGNLADRFGGKRVIQISMVGCLPFLGLFFLTEGWIALACLAMAGLLLLFTIPVNVVMGQQLAPGQAGTVSALLMGFSWGSAGLIFIPLTGWAADHVGLGTAMAVVSAFPLLGFVLSFAVTEERRAHG